MYVNKLSRNFIKGIDISRNLIYYIYELDIQGVITINIRAIRKEKGLTQKDMATSLNVQQSTVSMWETGESKPRADMLIAIAKYLDCTVDELLVQQ